MDGIIGELARFDIVPRDNEIRHQMKYHAHVLRDVLGLLQREVSELLEKCDGNGKRDGVGAVARDLTGFAGSCSALVSKVASVMEHATALSVLISYGTERLEVSA